MARAHAVRHSIALLAIAVVGSAVAAEPRPTLDELCKMVPCRQPKKVVIPLDKEHVFEGTMPKAPYYHDGYASIVFGETLYLEGDIGADGVLRLTYRPKNVAPTKTIVMSLASFGGSAYEHWPYALTQAALTGFKAIDPKEASSRGCK